MPFCIKWFKRFALVGGSVVATGVFFVLEILFEQKVVGTAAETVTKHEDWREYKSCITDKGYAEAKTTHQTHQVVDSWIGNYNPSVNLLGYLTAVIL